VQIDLVSSVRVTVLEAVLYYFTVVSLKAMKPQLSRVRAIMFTNRALEYLIQHSINLEQSYQMTKYIKQCDCIDTTASVQALLGLNCEHKS